MTTNNKLFNLFLTASFLLSGYSLQGDSPVFAQGTSNALNEFTKNQLSKFTFGNSVGRFNTEQYKTRVFQNAIPRFSQFNNASIQKQIFGSAFNTSRPKSKPFSSARRGPSVTPYLGLTGLPTGGAPNYYTNVKPQLEQQRINERNQRQNAALQRQLNQVAAKPPFDLRGSETIAPTGHSAVFMNLGGYYPQSN